MTVSALKIASQEESAEQELDAVFARIPAVVIDKHVSDTGIDAEAARARFRELARYLLLGRDGGGPDVPSRIVDDAWHTFILDTLKYRDFCEGVFGRFVHHCPGVPGEDPLPMLKGYNRTRRRLIARYGTIDEAIWPDEENAEHLLTVIYERMDDPFA